MGPKSFFLQFLQPVKGLDMYGTTINFTYKGEDQYKTYTGGFASLIIFGVMAYYTYFLFDIMIRKDDTTKNTDRLVRDLFSDYSNSSLASSNLSFAFVIGNDTDIQTYNIMLDRQFFDARLTQGYTINGTSYEYSVPLVGCNGTNFRFGDGSQLSDFNINSVYA